MSLPFDVWRRLMKKYDLEIFDYLELPSYMSDVQKILFLIALKAKKRWRHAR